jgi:hypothetical protein
LIPLQGDAVRSAPGNGDAGTVEFPMNTLELIRSRILKTKHLEDAQMLMAKSYRGVAYVDAHHDEPATGDKPKELAYRGQHYVH